MHLLAHGGMLPLYQPLAGEQKISPRRKGVKQGALIFLLGVLLVPILAVFANFAPGRLSDVFGFFAILSAKELTGSSSCLSPDSDGNKLKRARFSLANRAASDPVMSLYLGMSCFYLLLLHGAAARGVLDHAFEDAPQHWCQWRVARISTSPGYSGRDIKTARFKSTSRASHIGGTTRQEHREGE